MVFWLWTAWGSGLDVASGGATVELEAAVLVFDTGVVDVEAVVGGTEVAAGGAVDAVVLVWFGSTAPSATCSTSKMHKCNECILIRRLSELALSRMVGNHLLYDGTKRRTLSHSGEVGGQNGRYFGNMGKQ